MKNKKLSIVLVLAFIFSVALTGYLAVGFAGMLFSVTFIGGFIMWLFTMYRKPIDTQKIIIPYLVTTIFFIIHVYEEYLGHAETELTKLSGYPVTQHNFLAIAAFSAPIIWITGLLLSMKRWQFGYYLFSTFLFGMMLGELSHFFSPFADGGYHYSAGLYTAILPISGAWYMFRIIIKEMKIPAAQSAMQ